MPIFPKLEKAFSVSPASRMRRDNPNIYIVNLPAAECSVVNPDETAVASVLQDYEAALNASDAEAALRLYAPDGVFMPQHSPASVGAAAVRRAYDAVFAAITLSVKFAIVEIRQLAPDWVLARTNSAGTTKDHATGAASPEANQELFLFQRIDGAWKIARYCFCTTNPPRG
jgi:uncharacterized protein (TIGR02246 family)